MKTRTVLFPVVVAAGLSCGTAAALDSNLYNRYQGYKQYQQRGQQKVLKQAREAARDWDFDLAEEHLAAARNMAYAPDEIRAVERLVADNRTAKADKERREREAAERQRREAEEQRQREEQERLAAQQSYSRPSSGSSSGGSVGWGGVDADCIGGSCGIDTLRLSLSGGPGIMSDMSRGRVMISPGYGGFAGTYHFEVVFGTTRLFNPNEASIICSGSVHVSGTKRNLSIRVYDNCRDAGTGEF